MVPSSNIVLQHYTSSLLLICFALFCKEVMHSFLIEQAARHFLLTRYFFASEFIRYNIYSVIHLQVEMQALIYLVFNLSRNRVRNFRLPETSPD